MTLEFEGLGFKDKIPTGITGEIQLLSITIPPTGSFDAGNKYYNSTNKLIYTAVTDNTWDGAIASIPLSNIFYTFDNEGTTEYYQWDGENLVEVSIGAFQLKANMSQDYTDDDPTKYPSSKALSEGLKHTSSFELFDIKTNSEPTAQKGWSCISYPEQKKLNKANVPTAYEFLKEKLDNVDATISPLTTVLTTLTKNPFAIIGDMVYFVRESYGIYKASYSDFANTANWTKVCDLISSNGIRGLSWDIENKLVGYVIDNYPNTPANAGVIVNLETGETVAQFEAQSSPNYSYHTFFFENCFYVSVANKSSDSCYRYNLSTSTYEKVFDNYNIYGYFSELINIFAYYNGYYYFNMKAYSDTIAVRATNIMDVSTYDQNYLVNTKQLKRVSVYKDNKLYGCSSTSGSYEIDRYYDLLTDTLVTDINLTPYTNIRELKKVYFGYIIVTIDSIYFTNNFEKYTKLYQHNNYSNYYGTDSNGSFVIVSIGGVVYCSAPEKVKTVYTDTINGIDIKYYKSGDWKICTPDIAVGNDTNLQSVYEYLGYLNYWWIDTTNEQITLQRNSNMWTMMYVGDDYEDDSLPSGNSTRLLPQKNYVEDTTSATISFDEDNIIQSNTDYVFGTLTSLEFDTDSYVENQLETTIKFTAGTGFTFTDNSGITWVDGTPTFTEGSNYLILIFNNLAFIREW